MGVAAAWPAGAALRVGTLALPAPATLVSAGSGDETATATASALPTSPHTVRVPLPVILVPDAAVPGTADIVGDRGCCCCGCGRGPKVCDDAAREA